MAKFIKKVNLLRNINTPEDYTRQLDQVNAALDGFDNGLADSVIVPNVKIGVSKTSKSALVNNPLDRKVQGVFPINQTAPYFVIMAPTQGNIDPTKQVRLEVYGIPGVSDVTGPVVCTLVFV